jgi:hypothetical protein
MRLRIMLPLLAFAAAISLSSLPARAAEDGSIVVQPPAGTFKMLPELMGKHPRLHFTAADLPAIIKAAHGENKFYLDAARRAFGEYIGKDKPANPEDWKKYLYGFWGLFAMDMFAVVDNDARALATAKKWALQQSKETWWIADDLNCMDTLSGISLTYDILYDQFTEAERAQLREAIFKGVEFISKRFFVGDYWTHDYQNNHHQNRIHGLAHGAFAIYGDDPKLDVQKQADLAISEIETMIKWLPEDGSQHEGPGYWCFGHHWVERSVLLAEHVTGKKLMATNPHFANAAYFRIYMTAPGWKDTFGIGDASSSGGIGNPTQLLPGIRESKDPYGMAVMAELQKVASKDFFQHPAWGLLWNDASIKPRPIEELPLGRFWPDLEMFSARSGWDAGATAMVFKCGPPGGHKMQQIRKEAYVNVAHDHPDQNHFMLYAFGKMLAQDDDYAHEKKLTRSHNTITVDGKGQPRDGDGWQQPFPYKQTGTMDDMFLSGQWAYSTGNASRCYVGLGTFARHIAFMGGQYAIILDSLAGGDNKAHEFDWRLHNDGKWDKQGDDRFSVADGDVSLDIHFLLPEGGKGMESAFLPAELSAKPCLSVKQKASGTRFLSVLMPRKGTGGPEVKSELVKAQGCVAAKVSAADVVDLFAVPDAPGGFSCEGLKADGASALLRTKGTDVQFAMVTRGRGLTSGAKLMLGCNVPANLSWRKEQGQVVVDVEAPYKAQGQAATVEIGGLPTGRDMTLFIDGVQAKAPVNAGPAGTVSVQVDLKARHVIQVGGDKSAVTIIAPAKAQ